MRQAIVVVIVSFMTAACAFDTSGVRAPRETACDDGRDNDSDGFTDCDDQDCTGTPACTQNNVNNINNINNVTNPEICDNGVDDDGDSLIDCDDPDCATDLACWLEICDNGIDDNEDNLVDCDDPDCITADNCRTEICNNTIDDNGDSLIDCADPECAAAINCQDEICNNNIDDDGDNDIDCDDTDCAAAINCQDEICNNTIDDNGNGLADCADPDCAAAINCLINACTTPTAITCGGTANGTTVGGYSVFSLYPACQGATTFSGPEKAYRITPPSGSEVTVNLSNFGGNDLELFLTNPGCSNTTCIDSSTNGPGSAEQVTFTADGSQYSIIVETYSGASTFTLSVTCATPEICNNSIDDNANGYIDCVDYDCLGGVNSTACGDCNAITGYGCSGGTPNCEFDRATGYVGRCRATQGTGTIGTACSTETDCALGLFCHASNHVCTPLCHISLNDCPGGRTCYTSGTWGTTIYGYCQ